MNLSQKVVNMSGLSHKKPRSIDTGTAASSDGNSFLTSSCKCLRYGFLNSFVLSGFYSIRAVYLNNSRSDWNVNIVRQ